MIDLDYSFLRLRDNLTDALNLNEGKGVDLSYSGQVHLVPGETYLQISNSPTPINLSSYECHLVDLCGNIVVECTDNVFISPFTDTNGIVQIVWEFVNNFDYNTKLLSLRFTETSNNNQWFTSPFITTDYESDQTTRFDYKSNGYHNGTQYDRANFYQSIRLSGFYNNDVNESERSEYHQITTQVTVSSRNIKKIKERYLFNDLNGFVSRRIEDMITCDYVYTDNVITYSTNPLEFVEPEGDSNTSLHELLLNKDYSQIFTFAYQIYEGFNITSTYPADGGFYTLSNIDADLTCTFTDNIVLNTGTLTVYDASDNSVVASYTESDITVSNKTFTIAGILGTGNDIGANGNYYVQFSSGLITNTIGLTFAGINDLTTWDFSIIDGMYEGTDYNNDDYLTD